MITLDHLAVAGETLAAATAHCETALGLTMQPGGAHDVFFTHNTLLGQVDGLYLEAIAINPDAPKPDRPRWFDLDRFKGPARLTNWICRTDDLDATLAALPDGFGKPVSLRRGDLRWRMAVPVDGVLPFDNCAPALIEWESDTHPAQMLDGADITLERLTVTHPRAAELEQLLADRLQDNRVRFATGKAGLTASFTTGAGTVSL